MPSMDSASEGCFSPPLSANVFNTAVDPAVSMFCTATNELYESYSSALAICDARGESCPLQTCDYNLQDNTSSPSEFDYMGLGSLSTALKTRKRAALCLGDSMLDATRIDNTYILRGSDLTLKLAPPGDHLMTPIAILPSDGSGAKRSRAMLVDGRADASTQENTSNNTPKIPDCRLRTTASPSFNSCFSKDGQESGFRTAQAAIAHVANSARDEKNCSVGHVKLPVEDERAKLLMKLPGYTMRFNDDTHRMTVRRKEGEPVPLIQEFRGANLTESLPDHLLRIDKTGWNDGTTILESSRSVKCVRSVPKAEYTSNGNNFPIVMQIGNASLQDRTDQHDGCYIDHAPPTCTTTNLANLLQPSNLPPKYGETQDTCSLSCSNSQLQAVITSCSGGSRASASLSNDQNESSYACSSQRVIPSDQEFWLRVMHSPNESFVASQNENKALKAGGYNVKGGDELSTSATLVTTSQVSEQDARHGVDVVGWPPVNSYRKTGTHIPSPAKATEEMECRSATTEVALAAADNCCFQHTRIKASMDGAWFMRKLDLGSMHGYNDLCLELENLFQMSFGMSEMQADVGDVRVQPPFQSESRHLIRGTQYVITYEDMERDWMLAGDVPWEIFVQSVRRIRIMRRPLASTNDSISN